MRQLAENSGGFRRLCLVLACLAAGTGSAVEFAVAADQLDLDNCAVLVDGIAQPLDKEMMLNAMGLSETHAHYHRWHAARRQEGDARSHVYQYRIALGDGVPLGTIVYTTRRLAILKPTAPYPGDPADPDHWQPLQAAPNQGTTRIAVLPPESRMRAILFEDRLARGTSFLSPLRLWPRRLSNAAPIAVAIASSEYDAPRNFGSRLYAAANLVSGRGPWINAGKNNDGFINSPPISDLAPAWLAVAWAQPLTIQAVFLQDNFTDFRVDVFRGADTVSPLLAYEREWRRVPAEDYREVIKNGRWLTFEPPLITRGLRFYTDRVVDNYGKLLQVAQISDLMVLTDTELQQLGSPETVDRPKTFSVPMPDAGLLTVAVNDDSGRRVRNLFAREEYEAGPVEAAWDLRDDQGERVAPGTYTWQSISHPGIGVRYEFTVYPNVAQLHPENSAWLNGDTGSGGWLADHSPPFGVCTAGDWVFVGARVPEAGVGFAACDLSGRKHWGHRGFGPFSGARRMTANSRTVFVENRGIAYDDVGVEHVWAVDIGSHRISDVIARKSDERRLIGVSGLAASDERLYLAIHGQARWLTNAAGEDAVDIENCLPRYKPPRKPRRPYEIVPDPRNDFLRLFRLKGAPPGYAVNHGLTYLESTSGPERKQHLVLTFSQPINLGSCVLPVPLDADYAVRLSVLKPEAKVPPEVDDDNQWLAFEQQPQHLWDVVPAPPGVATRALRVTFVKGGEDELLDAAEALADDDLFATSGTDNGLGPVHAWHGRLEGLQLLRRRFANCSPTADVQVSSGKIGKDGVWVAERQAPLSALDPEIYLMTWATAQPLRGLAIKEIDCSLAEIDVWTGPDGAIDMRGNEHWQTVGKYIPRRRMQHPGFGGHNALARYMDATVDFGREINTRAVRLRVVEQWLTHTREGSCAKDELDLDPSRCRLFGVAAVRYLGGEVAVDPLATERLEVYDIRGDKPQLTAEFPLPDAGELALAPDGTLVAQSGSTVIRINPADGSLTTLIDDLVTPLSLAVGGTGEIFVFDAAPARRVIRVYDATGSFLRELGDPGGYRPGPWEPRRLQQITGLAVDRRNQVWAVDGSYWPKRVSVWSTAGEFQREYLGPTRYGSAGILDPWDKSRLTMGPLEFELNWTDGTSRLKSLTWDPADGNAAGDMPIHLGDRLYLVTSIPPASATMPVGIVYLYDPATQRCRQVAAMGLADQWRPLQDEAIRDRLGAQLLTGLQFLWQDESGDGEVQYEEIAFAERRISGLTPFNRDLSVQAGNLRFEVSGIRDDGVPTYRQRELPLPNGVVYQLNPGRYHLLGNGGADVWYNAAGQALASYPNLGTGVGPNRTAPPYTPEQVLCQFGIIGHETAADGDLGEFFVIHQNLGSWNIWTADGLLAGRIFRENRDPLGVYWQMPEHQRGMEMDDLTLLEEHFSGWLCRSQSDGRYYAVAGKNHASLLAITGLDAFRRSGGSFEVTQADINQTQEWERGQARREVAARIHVADCAPLPREPRIDGKFIEWQDDGWLSIGPGLTAQVAWYEEVLVVGFRVTGAGPLQNRGGRWDQLFKSGACLDLQLATDPAADPNRTAPAAGDKRLLATIVDGTPMAVLYDYVVPEAPASARWQVASPVGETTVDVVKQITNFELGAETIWYDKEAETGYLGYTAELAVPFAELGLAASPGLRVKFEVGVLQADGNGSATVRRQYWANPMHMTVSDIPSEARIQPDLWGWLRFLAKPTGPTLPSSGDLMKNGSGDPVVEELLDGLDLE